MRLLLAAAVVAILQSPADAAPSLSQHYDDAKAVILVQVISSTYPLEGDVLARADASASVVVMRSWKGPLAAGTSLQVGTQRLVCGGLCIPYRFLAGQKVLIFAAELNEPIYVDASNVLDGPAAKAATADLDTLVKRRAGT
jgi:hypothetical protein